MAIVDQVAEVPCLTIRGKHSIPGGFGDIVLGLSQFGFEDPLNGVYQMRYREFPQPGYGYNKKAAKIAVRLRYYWPFNPNSPGQQAGRLKFKNGMIAWNALTDEEQQAWKIKGNKLRTWGHSLFLKAYMLDRELKP